MTSASLIAIGRAIIRQLDAGTPAADLVDDLVAFAGGLALLDGRIPADLKAPAGWTKAATGRLRHLVGIEVRELGVGEAVRSEAPRVTAIAPTSDLVDALENRVVARARTAAGFDSFAEMVSVDDITGEPIEQAPLHRQWSKLAGTFDRLLIWSHINSGKTTQLSILRTVWELGRERRLRFIVLSNTAGQATRIVRAISSLIKTNEAVRRIFPDLRPDEDASWTTTELTVKRPGAAKDPSVRAVGLHGGLISARADRLILDDVLDLENTDTAANRAAVEQWVRANALGRLSKSARVIAIGTAWHPSDLMHTLEGSGAYHAARFPVVEPDGRVAWPESWPPERIERTRRDLGPAEFARQCLCQARDDDEARFKKTWIDAAVARGRSYELLHALDDVPEGCAVFTGVDLAVGKGRRTDLTAFFTFLEDASGNRRVLAITSGKFTGPEIVNRIVDHHRRYHSTIAVENVAAQDFILQFARETSNVPIVPHTTTKSKRDPILGVEGLAVELANGKWTIPGADHPEIESWISEMLFFSPHTHTGDRLMASYFARDLARQRLGGRPSATPEVGLRIVGDATPIEAPRSFADRMNAGLARRAARSAELDDDGRGEDHAREAERNERHAGIVELGGLGSSW